MSGSQQTRKGFVSTLRRIICRLVCDDEPAPLPPKVRPIAFEPGKVVILTEFPPDLKLTPREIVARVSARLAKLQLDSRMEVNLAPERVIVLRSAQRTLASVTGDVPAARQSPRQLIRFISQLHRTIALPPLIPPPEPGQDLPKGDPTQQGAPADQSQPPTGDNPAPSAGLAAEARASQAPAMLTAAMPTRPATADADGFDLRAASPNWLSSGAMNIGGGGPGAWPVSVPSVTPNPADPQPWDFIIPTAFQSPSSGAPVEVAILDTVPSFLDLQNAYSIWVGDDLAQPPVPPLRVPNPLLRELLAGPQGGPFNVVNQSGTTAVSPVDQLDVLYQPGIIPANLLEHPYPMASHGLFVAGIIRSIAPQAKLRLIQVLNEDGGGSVESITQGLSLADRPGRSVPLVINCSFTLSIPRPGEDLGGATQAEIDQLTQLIQDAFVHVCQSPAVVIIAAAGNNQVVPAAGHLQARYPAAFDGVSGVAALAKDDLNPSTPDVLATYSDLADDQASQGFAAFGGDVAAGPAPSKADAANGMLGVFIEDLPEELPPPTGGVALTPNTSGWARWAGTSFSAPVVSAILANLISRNNMTPLVARQQLGISAPDTDVSNAVPARQVI
jgi:subtilase family protein